MNKQIARILYYTHDKWEINVKYREELIEMLNFCFTHSQAKTERTINKILFQVEEKKGLLTTKGAINIFIKEIPDVMQDYRIFFNNNLVDKFNEEKK